MVVAKLLSWCLVKRQPLLVDHLETGTTDRVGAVPSPRMRAGQTCRNVAKAKDGDMGQPVHGSAFTCASDGTATEAGRCWGHHPHQQLNVKAFSLFLLSWEGAGGHIYNSSCITPYVPNRKRTSGESRSARQRFQISTRLHKRQNAILVVVLTPSCGSYLYYTILQ